MTVTKRFLLLVALVACKGGAKEEAAKPPPAATDAAIEAKPTAAADAAAAARPVFRPDPATEHTAESFEKLYAAVAACKLVDDRLEKDCPEELLLEEVSSRTGASSNPSWADNIRTEHAVAVKMMGHEAPPVRVEAFTQIHAHGDAYDAMAETLAREQDPAALRAMALAVSGRDEYAPKLAEQVVRLADHADPAVRRYILGGLGNGRKVPGAFEALRAHAEADADEEVRRRACEALGELGDRRALPVLEKLLVPATGASIYDRCLAGLIHLWMHPDSSHQEAYRATLKLIARPDAPVIDDFPALWALGQLPSWLEDAEYAKAKRFVKLRDVEKALVALASAKQAAPPAREAAVATLVELGADQKVFHAIRKSLPATVPEESELEELIAEVDEARGVEED